VELTKSIIDVVTKKSPDLVLTDPIGKLFRRVNILEYKSPQESLSIHSFHKARSYVELYMALHKVKITDITLSFIASIHPRKVLGYVKKALGYKVEKSDAGVYHIIGGDYPMQIVDITELLPEDYLWMHSLRANLDSKAVRRVREAETALPADTNKETYMGVFNDVNFETVREEDAMRLGDNLKRYAIELGLDQEWTARGEARGENKVLLLMEQGYTAEQIREKLGRGNANLRKRKARQPS
jgi:hypothetical protein